MSFPTGLKRTAAAAGLAIAVAGAGPTGMSTLLSSTRPLGLLAITR